MDDPRFARLKFDPLFAERKKKKINKHDNKRVTTESKHKEDAVKTKRNSDQKRKFDDDDDGDAAVDDEGRVVVDERFASMFTDPDFQPKKGKIDKYGRETSSQKNKAENDLKRFYAVKEESGKSSSSSHASASVSAKVATKKPKKKKETRIEYLNRLARGELDSEEEAALSSSEDEDDEEEEESEDEDETARAVERYESMLAQYEEETPELGEASGRRLAVLNCDWDKIRAVDILAVVQSFCPATGKVFNVAIYPSQFGLERLKQEEIEGPAFLVDPSKEGNNDESESEDEEENQGNVEGKGFNPELLRLYERQRLKYYFAVVTCDSIATASAVYDACDGVEFEHSSIVLDLRFIPDDMKFDETLRRDYADRRPQDYAPFDFVGKLQKTRVDLTWDEPEYDRRKLENWNLAMDDGDDEYDDEDETGEEDGKKKKKKKKTMNGGKKSRLLNTRELEAFVAEEDEENGGEEEEEDRETEVRRYRALLLGESAGARSREEEEEEEDFQEFADDDDDGEDDVVEQAIKSTTKMKKRATTESIAKTRVEDALESTKRMKVNKNEKAQEKEEKKKKKKRAKRDDDDEEEEETVLDMGDARFAGLYTDPAFSLDRTDPKYKPSTATKMIDEEVRKRRRV